MPKPAPASEFSPALAACALAIVAAGSAAAAPAKHSGTTLVGAGSSFVAPLVSQWIPAVGSAFGYELQYSPIGSGGGISAIQARTVDFGASDAPLTPDQFTACKGCVQIPWALSTRRHLQPGRRQNNLKIDGPTSPTSSWEHQDLERPGDREAEQRAFLRARHRNRPSLGQLGHDHNFSDYLSTVSRPEVGLVRRRRQLALGHRCTRQRASQPRSARPGRHRVRRHRYAKRTT